MPAVMQRLAIVVAVSVSAASPLATPALTIARMSFSWWCSVQLCGLVRTQASRVVRQVLVWAGARLASRGRASCSGP